MHSFKIREFIASTCACLCKMRPPHSWPKHHLTSIVPETVSKHFKRCDFHFGFHHISHEYGVAEMEGLRYIHGSGLEKKTVKGSAWSICQWLNVETRVSKSVLKGFRGDGKICVDQGVRVDSLHDIHYHLSHHYQKQQNVWVYLTPRMKHAKQKLLHRERIFVPLPSLYIVSDWKQGSQTGDTDLCTSNFSNIYGVHD